MVSLLAHEKTWIKRKQFDHRTEVCGIDAFFRPAVDDELMTPLCHRQDEREEKRELPVDLWLCGDNSLQFPWSCLEPVGKMPSLLPNVDADGLLEYSVVYTDRALNHMSEKFQSVMRDLSVSMKRAYNSSSVAIIPGSGTYGMEAVARQFATGKHVVVIRNGWFSYRYNHYTFWLSMLRGAIVSIALVQKSLFRHMRVVDWGKICVLIFSNVDVQ